MRDGFFLSWIAGAVVGLLLIGAFTLGHYTAKRKYECHQIGGGLATNATKVNGKWMFNGDSGSYKICK